MVIIDIIKMDKKEKCSHSGFEPNNGGFKCKYCGKEFTIEETDKLVFDRLEKINNRTLTN